MMRGSGISRAGAAALSRPGTAAGRFLWLTPPGVGLTTNGAPSAAAARLSIYPFFVSEPDPIVSLSIVTGVGGAGSSVKIGLWSNDPVAGWPVGLPLVAINTPIDTTVAETDTVAITPIALVPGTWAWVVSNWTGTAPQVQRAGSCAGVVASPTAGGFDNSFFSAEAFATDFTTLNLTGRSWSTSGANVLAVQAGY